MSPSRIYICLRSSVTSDTQRHTVNPQMAAQPIMVAITVIIASRVFCSRDFISMIILFVGLRGVFQISSCLCAD